MSPKVVENILAYVGIVVMFFAIVQQHAYIAAIGGIMFGVGCMMEARPK